MGAYDRRCMRLARRPQQDTGSGSCCCPSIRSDTLVSTLKGTGTTKQTDPVILRHADSGGLLGRGPQGTHGKQSGGKDRQRRPSEVGGQHAEDGWRKRKKDGQDGKGQINVGCCLIIPGSWWQFRAAVILSKDRSAGSSVLGGDDMQS